MLNLLNFTKLIKSTALRHCLFLVLLVSPSAAQEISFTIKAYGSRHAILSFSGPSINKLSINPSVDGQALRVTGIDIRFIEPNLEKTPDIFSSIRQVKRGVYTDLVFNIRVASDFSVTNSNNILQVFIKGKSNYKIEEKPSQENSATTTPTPTENLASRRLPFNIVFDSTSGDSNSDLKNSNTSSSTNIIFPSTAGLKSITSLGAELRTAAYSLDLIWSFLSGIPIESTEKSDSKNTCQQNSNPETEQLILDMTTELNQLRTQLEAKELELSKFKPLP